MAEQEFSFCPYCGAKLNPEGRRLSKLRQETAKEG
jgi:hypothetical protein